MLDELFLVLSRGVARLSRDLFLVVPLAVSAFFPRAKRGVHVGPAVLDIVGGVESRLVDQRHYHFASDHPALDEARGNRERMLDELDARDQLRLEDEGSDRRLAADDLRHIAGHAEAAVVHLLDARRVTPKRR